MLRLPLINFLVLVSLRKLVSNLFVRGTLGSVSGRGFGFGLGNFTNSAKSIPCRHATRMLKLTSKESHEALEQGLSIVFEKFLTKFLEEDLAPWETYCKEACLKVPAGLVLPEKFDESSNVCEDEDARLDVELISLRERKAAAEKETAKLRRDIKALEALVEAKASFLDAFDQLQNLPLIDDLGSAVRELRKGVEEANALRTRKYQNCLFPANPSASGKVDERAYLAK